VKKGFDKKVPETSTEFSEAWKNSKERENSSKAHKEFDSEIDENSPVKVFMAAVDAQKRKGAPKSGVHTTNFLTQVWASTVRKRKIPRGGKEKSESGKV
jgi:hypothetical protein